MAVSLVATPAMQLSGLLLLAMILIAVANGVVSIFPSWLAGTLAWLALLFVLPGLANVQRIQAAVLITLGVISALWGWSRGSEVDVLAMLSKNEALLALLAGVSYLRLLNVNQSQKLSALPRGRMAFLRTLIGTHLFASVINLSALLMVVDRLTVNNKLEKAVAIPLMRTFSAAAFWSPFFAAMGVALTYAPDASPLRLVLQGIPLVVFALLYTFIEFNVQDQKTIDCYQGYPVHFSTLWIPSLMVICVVVLHDLYPSVSVILIVAGLSVFITGLFCLLREPAQAFIVLRQHTFSYLPKMSSELALFLSAGVLAVGLSTLFQSFNDVLPEQTFSFLLATVLLYAIVLFAILGVHPVISIAAMGVWVAPMQADHNVLGTVFLSGWAIGVIAAPLSGLNLALRSRYGLTARHVFIWHYRYVISMLLVTTSLLWVYLNTGAGG